MKFKIVYDKPGRIRFRCGAYAFEKELESAVQKAVLDCAFASEAEVHSENGGILVYYQKGHRSDIVQIIAGLNPRKLTPIPESSGTEQIDTDFKKDLVKLVAKRFLCKALLPTPISNCIVFFKGIRYLWRAVDALGQGHLNGGLHPGKDKSCINRQSCN